MTEAYASAAGRHWEDAALLLGNDQFDNAAYLSGYAVECSLKVIVQAAGANPKTFGHNLTILSGVALRLAFLLAPAARRYPFPRSADFDDLVQRWAPSMRYLATGQVDRRTAVAWLKVGKDTYFEIVVQAILDGWSRLS